ncbi:MAG: hypothetical protein GY757_46245 [bacterium]|nr:hypothetical protein [bacterium]
MSNENCYSCVGADDFDRHGSEPEENEVFVQAQGSGDHDEHDDQNYHEHDEHEDDHDDDHDDNDSDVNDAYEEEENFHDDDFHTEDHFHDDYTGDEEKDEARRDMWSNIDWDKD